jgi:hypothetical protein
MSAFVFSVMILAMLMVLGTLGIGLVSMIKGGVFAKTYGNKLMQARVYLQAGAIMLFLLAIAITRK